MIAAAAAGGALRIEDVRIALRGRPLLQLDAAVAPGAVLAVTGPSGAGKSTLLACLAGVLPPAFTATGSVRLGGEDLTRHPPERRRMGLLTQEPLLFPHMSVGANLLFGLAPAVRGRAARRAACEAMLGRIALPGVFDRDPASLSGGQQARVALARTLLAAPRALLLDEAFRSLDAALAREMRALVLGLVREARIPALIATHDPADAAELGAATITVGQPAGGAGTLA